jgi:chemotaxis response regulator CheB
MKYSSHTIGIILSGMLDNGTSGMWAIKRSGGTCVVQDPNEAEYPEMPLILKKYKRILESCVNYVTNT